VVQWAAGFLIAILTILVPAWTAWVTVRSRRSGRADTSVDPMEALLDLIRSNHDKQIQSSAAISETVTKLSWKVDLLYENQR
jgi:hypothetical protein